METKWSEAYLSGVRNRWVMVEYYEKRIKQMEDQLLAYGGASFSGERVQSSPKRDSLEERVIRFVENEGKVIQELGVYESIHEEEIKKAVNIGDIRDMYFTGAAQLDPYWENFGKPKTERSGWIPVSERMPELNQNVIVTYNKEDEFRVDISHYSKHGFWIGNVVAWMPLPEPYKPNEDNVSELCRSNYAAQLESLGYNPDGNPKNGGKQ